jgi:hypothetical protein
MKMPSREWTGAVTVIVVALVLAALDILDGSVHRWWAEHAFTTSLVGGLLVLLVTVLIADRVVTAPAAPRPLPRDRGPGGDRDDAGGAHRAGSGRHAGGRRRTGRRQ